MDRELTLELKRRLVERGFSNESVETFFMGKSPKVNVTEEIFRSWYRGRREILNDDEVFEFVVAFKRRHDGNSPSMREIVQACESVSSTSQAFKALNKLEGLGMIRVKGVRQIEVVGGSWGIGLLVTGENKKTSDYIEYDLDA